MLSSQPNLEVQLENDLFKNQMQTLQANPWL